jgi:pyruvate dehydrogenase E1 component beta subunit
MPVIEYREALNQALAEEMERDERVFLMGEEVAEYNGAYKVSKGLLERFGPKRVIDTPISENGFTGIGVGAAMNGLKPVIEMMTWNFSLVAIDQIISNAAKTLYMSGGQFKVPMVIRGAGGAGGKLASQHSQSLEAIYAHIPGLKVACPATGADAKGMLKTAIRDEDPIIFIESETLYGKKFEVPEGEHLVPFGVADVVREGTDVTIGTLNCPPDM